MGMPPLPKLLLATRNLGKIREYGELLKGIPFQMVSLAEAGVTEEVPETGDSFSDNACLKARGYASLSGLFTLADDSGLVVDALGGEPGVKSARYGDCLSYSDEDRVQLLLRNLEHVSWEQRMARFQCVIAVTWPSGEVRTVAGTVEGIIQYEAKGANGFGYDPVFHLPHLGVTMAEIPPEEKNRLSHRAQASRKAVALLKELAKDSLC